MTVEILRFCKEKTVIRLIQIGLLTHTFAGQPDFSSDHVTACRLMAFFQFHLNGVGVFDLDIWIFQRKRTNRLVGFIRVEKTLAQNGI